MRVARIDLIEEYVLRKKSVSLDTLCEEFSVSKNTIRRDIDTLLKRGTVKKVYGGVTSLDETDSVLPLLSYNERDLQYRDEKDAICRQAARFVAEHDIIYIDTGTSCLNLIDYISDIECTVITNSLQLFLKGANYPKLTIISMSGKLKRETLSFVGPEAIDSLRTYNITKAFMAATGISVKNGLTNASTEEYAIKRAVMENCEHAYLLADHSKFGKVSLMTYGALSELEAIITDQPLAEEYETYCAEHQVGICIPM